MHHNFGILRGVILRPSKNQGQKRYPKQLGAICLQSLVLLGSALELFRKLLGAVRASFWLWVSFLALEKRSFKNMRKITLRGCLFICLEVLCLLVRLLS